MPLPLEHLYPLIIVFCVTLGLVGAAVIFFVHFGPDVAWRLVGYRHAPADGQRPCRYCLLGRASLHEEKVALEGDDLVEVRCFICQSCGLPQWTVARSAVLRKAA